MIYAHARATARKMNRLEGAYALMLEARKRAGEILWWEFERLTLKLADDCRYTPDFSLVTADGELQCHETKGFMREDALVKLKVAATMFPWRFFLVQKQAAAEGGAIVIDEVKRA